jgi:FkbM family methyltransferase
MSQILTALTRPMHYHAALQMFRVYSNPVDGFRRYLLGMGDYPSEIGVKSPLGRINVRAYSHHDILTINEIFCREDYFASGSEDVFVDFGSNIGISAAYFLTRSSRGFAYLYEPVPTNVERLRNQLSFLDRFSIDEVAIAAQDGMVRFGVEATGRYGGIGVNTSEFIDVKCIDSNDVLRAVIAKHGKIDILKIDIEGLEGEVVTRIPPGLLPKIHTIYAEWACPANPIARTHIHRQYGSVAQFRRISSA